MKNQAMFPKNVHVFARTIKSRFALTPNSNKNAIKLLFEGNKGVISSYINRITESKHPLLRYLSDFQDGNIEKSYSLRALAVLMVSKAMGFPSGLSSSDIDLIEERQRALADIAELIYSAQALHKTVVEVLPNDPSASSLHLGNKLAILMGDLLLAKSSKNLAELKNSTVTELMSNSIADFTQSELLYSNISSSSDHKDLKKTVLNDSSYSSNRNKSSNDISNCRNSSHLTIDKWREKTELSIGSLIGHACRCSSIFTGHNVDTLDASFQIGRYIGLILQIHEDLLAVDRYENILDVSYVKSDVWTLPVACLAEMDPQVLEKRKPFMVIDSARSSPRAMEQTKEILQSLGREALSLTERLPSPQDFRNIIHEFLNLDGITNS